MNEILNIEMALLQNVLKLVITFFLGAVDLKKKHDVLIKRFVKSVHAVLMIIDNMLEKLFISTGFLVVKPFICDCDSSLVSGTKTKIIARK